MNKSNKSALIPPNRSIPITAPMFRSGTHRVDCDYGVRHPKDNYTPISEKEFMRFYNGR